MTKKVAVIGGGIIGLSTAWYCQRLGFDVTVIDRGGRSREGCSFGNAGMIVPSHFVPLAAPGMIRLGLKWMLNPESPFSIRPKASRELMAWLWHFRRASTAGRVRAAAPLLRDLHLKSRQCYVEMESQLPGGFGLKRHGLLMLCRTEAALREEAETAELANELGVPAEVHDAEATARLDPAIEMSVCGSVHYPRDCHLAPRRLMDALTEALEAGGCGFRWKRDVVGFRRVDQSVAAVRTDHEEIEADEVVVCGGVWSTELVGQLGLRMPMQAGKGYSLTLEEPVQRPEICSILTEARVAVTPIGKSLRIGGTMEIVGKDESISPARLRGITRAAAEYFPRFSPDDWKGSRPWVGLRPCSPDGLPYLGRLQGWRNVVVSSGHAMMGISLAMVSAEIVSKLLAGESSGIDRLELLSPDRYK